MQVRTNNLKERPTNIMNTVMNIVGNWVPHSNEFKHIHNAITYIVYLHLQTWYICITFGLPYNEKNIAKNKRPDTRLARNYDLFTCLLMNEKMLCLLNKLS